MKANFNIASIIYLRADLTFIIIVTECMNVQIVTILRSVYTALRIYNLYLKMLHLSNSLIKAFVYINKSPVPLFVDLSIVHLQHMWVAQLVPF